MSSLKWWENAVIYQIYPRSFQDSNDDGIGDLNGITTRLNYLSELGIDAIWISPFFKSPQKDFGYDVSDYYNISPEYGTLRDFDLLISKAHELKLRVMLDIVPAHCSSEHPWFVESRSSTTNPKADWFNPKMMEAPPQTGYHFLAVKLGPGNQDDNSTTCTIFYLINLT